MCVQPADMRMKERDIMEIQYTLFLYKNYMKYFELGLFLNISKCMTLIARLAIFSSILVKLLIFQLKSVKAEGNLISSANSIKI